MEDIIQSQLLEEIKKKVDESGFFSIREAAALIGQDISLSEQKRIAKLLVKTNPYLTEINNGSVIVKQNKLFDSSEAEKNKNSIIKIFVILLIAISVLFGILKIVLGTLNHH